MKQKRDFFSNLFREDFITEWNEGDEGEEYINAHNTWGVWYRIEYREHNNYIRITAFNTKTAPFGSPLIREIFYGDCPSESDLKVLIKLIDKIG